MKSINTFLIELKDILNDIKNKKNFDPNDKSNGFTDNFTLIQELEMIEKIEQSMEDKEPRIIEKIINNSGEKLSTDELMRLISKDKKLSILVSDMYGLMSEIKKIGVKIEKYKKSLDEMSMRYDFFKNSYVGIIKKLMKINDNIEEIKECTLS